MIWYQGFKLRNGNPRNMIYLKLIQKLNGNDQVATNSGDDTSFSETCPAWTGNYIWRHIALVFDDANNQLQLVSKWNLVR